MEKNKEKELKRVAAMADSLFYAIDELMGKMQVDDGNFGFNILPEDEEAFIAIGELHDIIDEHRWRIRNICNKLKEEQ